MRDSSIELAVQDPREFALFFAERLLSRLESGGRQLEWVYDEIPGRYDGRTKRYLAVLELDDTAYLIAVTDKQGRYDNGFGIEISRLFTVGDEAGVMKHEFRQIGHATGKDADDVVARLYRTLDERHPARLESWRLDAATEFFGL